MPERCRLRRRYVFPSSTQPGPHEVTNFNDNKFSDDATDSAQAKMLLSVCHRDCPSGDCIVNWLAFHSASGSHAGKFAVCPFNSQGKNHSNRGYHDGRFDSRFERRGIRGETGKTVLERDIPHFFSVSK
ncbi:hypothetical protein K439DRAFT_250036 [Ramaria rubella]|nr:hypothetical protein K439DRAFT_250036 [Ramaria rubella]